MIEAGRFLQQRYRIDKQIGQGGMGAVYVATDERFGSTVAIKETLCMDSNFRKAIEREARLLNSLKHGALPRVSDHFVEDDGQFLVMEYVQGEDLAHMLEREHAAFAVPTVLNWADQLLDALDYLHNQTIPVIHRDIKPQNLKLTSRGQIVLLDFGLAKGNPTDAGHNTAAKSIFGYSRSYASLEQIQGTGTDPRSDLYSLAATLYHLLTGRPPEDALTRAMAVLSQKPDPLVPANAIRPEIPAGVAGVLLKAMDLNADGRPASAAEMRQMFRDNDKYAALANAIALPTLDLAGAIPQPTKILPDHTRRADLLQTDVKTEVLPANPSELTSIKPGSTAAAAAVTAVESVAPKQRKPMRAISAAAILLLGALAAAGVYVVKPSLFGLAPTTVEEPVNPPAVQQADRGDESLVAPQASPGVAEGAPAIEEGANSTLSRPSEQPRQLETTRNGKASTGRSQTNAGDGDLTLTDPDVPGVTTVRDKNGRTITIRPAPLPPPTAGQHPPNQVNPFSPDFDPNKFQQLTPAQRRKLQQALRNAQRQQLLQQQRNSQEPKN